MLHLPRGRLRRAWAVWADRALSHLGRLRRLLRRRIKGYSRCILVRAWGLWLDAMRSLEHRSQRARLCEYFIVRLSSPFII